MTIASPGAVPCVNVAGKVRIFVNSGNAGAMESLGYSINGVQIVERPFYTNIPGDENGGDEGPPVDKQYLGELHYLRMELSKWDDTVAGKIRGRLRGVNAEGSGAFTPGSLITCGGYYFRLLLLGANFVRNYLLAVPSEPTEINVGTRWSRPAMEWECQRNSSGVMWNTTATD